MSVRESEAADPVVGSIVEALRDRHGALTLAGLLTLGRDDEESSHQEELLAERASELELAIYMIESGVWKKSGGEDGAAEMST